MSSTPSQPTPPAVKIEPQELRLALAFTGGVSLAIWMGGVAREVDLLVQSSDRRGVLAGGQSEPATPDDDPVRRLYQGLLDLVDLQVVVDALAGTSAGGINAALLGLVNARRSDLGPLRDIWLSAGALDQLLRDPREANPPSLLKGDGQLLTALEEGITKIVGGRAVPPLPRRTDVFITTTLLSSESSTFVDDYGTEIADTDHHGQFHFNENSLGSPGVEARLALAARSSASFPAAFEPSFIPFGANADAAHPDMAANSNATRSHWAADGGLLVNRPIAPLLQSIFDRPADQQVRRTLLYVVPSSGSTAAPVGDEQAKPLGIGEALLADLGAVLNQSIAADLTKIKEHNDRTRAAADTRLRLASLGSRLPDGERLIDQYAWTDYLQRQSDWLIAPIVSELTRQVTIRFPRPEGWTGTPEAPLDASLRDWAKAKVLEYWPAEPPATAADSLEAAVKFGRAASDAAKATVLRLLRLGYILASTSNERTQLASVGGRIHGALGESGRTDLRSLVEERLTPAADAQEPNLKEAVEGLVVEITQPSGATELELPQWQVASEVLGDAIVLLQQLITNYSAAPPSAALTPASLPQRRAVAAGELEVYLAYLARGDAVVQLLDLHVATRSVLPVLLEVDQPVELVQVSADTRTLLAPSRSTAADKLTGMQLHHFGAFYKTSWRANDWMWGRLDGCGWLVHVLLDPRRIHAVLENDPVGPDATGANRASVFSSRLQSALEVNTPIPDDAFAELAFLDDATLPLPSSLPELSVWAADVIQQQIAAQELPCVAAHMRAGPEGAPSTAATTWLANFDQVSMLPAEPDRGVAALAKLVDSCPVPAETIQGEATSPLFIRTLTQTVAVTTAAVTAIKQTPAPLRPTFATARTITNTAYLVADKTHGARRGTALLSVALIVFGVLAMLSKTVLVGLPGLALFGAGAVLLALTTGRRLVKCLQIVVALTVVLLVAAPWISWLGDPIFSWFTDTAIPFIKEHKWPWPALLLLLLLPSATAAFGWLKTAFGWLKNP